MANHPRVLLVHEPPDGGVAQHVAALARGLRHQDIPVDVAGPPGALSARLLAGSDIAYHPVSLARGYGRPDRDAQAAAELGRLIRRLGVDVVHSHASKAGALGRLAARSAGATSVYTPHCFGFVGRVSRRRAWFAITTERRLARITDAIICVSEAERRRALSRRIGAPGRLHTILNGVPPCDATAPPDPALIALRRGGPVVGMITVMRLQKRIDVFLEAIPLVWRAQPSARFAVVGEGPLEGEVRGRAAELGLLGDDRVLFTRFTGPSERYLKALDLFALTSDWEAMSIGLLEAMACGVPQVVTDVDGCAEALGGATGRLVPPGDPPAFAQALVDLLGDLPARKRMETASVARHRERFTEDRMVAETAALYRRLTKQGQERAAPARTQLA